MHQLANEEKAALLLSAVDYDGDGDEDENHLRTNTSLNVPDDRFPVVAKRPKTYQRHPISNAHPLLCFTFVLGAFILGCLSGVIIMLYRIPPDSGQTSSSLNLLQAATNVDLTIRTKLLQSIEKANFINVTRSIESENDAANKLHEKWKSYSSVLTRVNKLTYDINLSQYASSTQWSGAKLLDSKDGKELLKVNRLSAENILSFSSFIKSGEIDGNSIYYVNYGRQEDFAYLFKNRINFQDRQKSIVFMRRQRTIISQSEQIHQAIYYGFAALVLFDDTENSQTKTTNDRFPFYQDWVRYTSVQERQNFLDSTINNENHSISVLILSYDDVERIFRLVQTDSNKWLMCPTEWTHTATALKIGGTLSTMKIRLVVKVEAIKIELPVVMSSVRGISDPDHFIMVGYQLGAMQQSRIINEIIEVYTNQIKNGWNPKRSILFCAWSGLDYDHYTIRRWLSDNSRFVDKNLIAYLDIGNGILGNSTLNLRGSPLFEQVAYQAANLVPSPLEHNHTCHHRLVPTTTVSLNEEHHHSHERKRRDGDEHQHHGEENEKQAVECEPHKLLDEWNRASNNQIGLNKTLGIVQTIDIDSSAALFQLQYGIPSILIEMTEQQALTNDTFYAARVPPIFERKLQPKVYVAYTQFVSEVIRRLVDEPLISFNLTNYAKQIDRQVDEYVSHYEREYGSVASHIGRLNEFIETFKDLTKSIQALQLHINQISQSDYFQLQSINKQLIEFERLFISNDQLPGMNSIDKKYKHTLIGPAYGLTNTAVPFPLLSNILYGIPEDPPRELCDTSKLFWSKLKNHIHFVNRTLNGFDGLVDKNK
ncbi:unnamed protein product [Rotaria magnacalcarata]|uniref:Transferrin receptor-like dimerisation domain-containing protein n=1 Tax=Rotaria magnacalcarata TaxID=392030 RepID=A0A818ZE79_9BILA|nr:unnamed protein product [Rotaria magnacalcarata]CAF2076008.1 unnamed protein product [Rotaria magnacalcarata]CAF3767299.1 unnamed protein product [Rotaria magnacalcarata]CAF3803791.1 unnamed protein product [Rotaria magnacalcarata]